MHAESLKTVGTSVSPGMQAVAAVQKMWQKIKSQHHRYVHRRRLIRKYNALLTLPPYALRDIGLTRDEIRTARLRILHSPFKSMGDPFVEIIRSDKFRSE